MNDTADVRQLVYSILRRWWVIALGIAAGAAIGYLVSRAQPPVYEATTTLIVGRSIQTSNLDPRDIETSQLLARTYADIARRQPVLQGTIDALSLDIPWSTLKSRVRVNLIGDTQLLEIVVEAQSPEEATAIADEVARQLILQSPSAEQGQENVADREFVRQRLRALQANIEAGQIELQRLETKMANTSLVDEKVALQGEINDLERLIANWQSNYTDLLPFAEEQQTPNYLAVVEKAQADPDAVRPRPVLNTALAGAVGLLLAVGAVALKERLDDPVRSAQDVYMGLGLTFLGAVRRVRGRDDPGKLLTSSNPLPRLSEDYRLIRSSIQFMSSERPVKSIMVTSPGAREGKTTIATNLAVVMADAGFKTVLVDADLRDPALHTIFQTESQPGLSDSLRSTTTAVDKLLRQTGVENLHLLTSGNVPKNPSEMLGSARMAQLLRSLSDRADVIVLDSPPTLEIADALALAQQVDGVVLVIEADRTHRDAARQALANLQHVGANVVGGVLNRVADKRTRFGL